MKPSERILQIAKEIIDKDEVNPPKNFAEGVDLRLESITRYLDEGYEQGKSDFERAMK